MELKQVSECNYLLNNLAIECIYQDMALSKKRITDLGSLSNFKPLVATHEVAKVTNHPMKYSPFQSVKKMWQSLNIFPIN